MATLVDESSISLSNNDFDVLFKAFQDKNFCKHFKNFAKEISDPKTLDHYETELKKLEKQRGVDVKLLQPSPGIALQAELADKTSIIFVNISLASKIEKPDFSCELTKFKWSVPHAVLKPRLEFNLGKFYSKWAVNNKISSPSAESLLLKAKKEGIWIYEIVVNPLCIDLAKQNEVLKNHLIQIAKDNIKKIHNVTFINEISLGFDAYVGNQSVSQIKSVVNLTLFNESKKEFDSLKLENVSNTQNEKIDFEERTGNVYKFSDEKSNLKIPSYKLKHVNHVTLQDYSLLKKNYPESLRPQILLLEVKLSGVGSASEIDVEASGKELHLKTEKNVKYNLDLTLPYEVEEDPKSAKFDISTGILEIELIVIKNGQNSLTQANDSGIECENGYRTNSEEDSASVSSLEENNLQVVKNDQENVNDQCIWHYMPKWQCSQSDNFLFMSVISENIIIKSIKLKITSLSTFKYDFKTINNKENYLPISYQGDVSVTPHSFKDKGITFHVLNKTLIIQVEKSSPGVWNKVEVKAQENNSSIDDESFSVNQENGSYSFSIDLAPLELNGDHQNFEPVTSSIDGEKFSNKNLKLSTSSKQDVEAFFKKPLLPHFTLIQSYNFLTINILCKNVNIKNIIIELIDQKAFRFQYKCFGNGLTPMFYGGCVNTAPYAFKNNGISHDIVDDVLSIQVEKKKPSLWRKVRIGQEQKKMKEIKVKTLKNTQAQNSSNDENEVFITGENEGESDNCKTESGAEEESHTQDEKSPSEDEGKKKKSSVIDIPQTDRNTNDCFVTGSWPRGILKSRSRSLSDSQVDSHFYSSEGTGRNGFSLSLDCDDDAVAEVTEDDVEMSDELTVGSSPKKSVRFNEFVCKQVFKVDSCIVGQKAKNMKKAQQRKRSRERKLSEGSQSSENETVTEQSDVATTTEDESNTDGENVGKESKKGKQSSNATGTKKKKDKSNKKNKKNKRPVLRLSNEMVFQLDDD